eukprot:jgi/Mesvir1/11257/Mv01061-RA.1
MSSKAPSTTMEKTRSASAMRPRRQPSASKSGEGLSPTGGDSTDKPARAVSAAKRRPSSLSEATLIGSSNAKNKDGAPGRVRVAIRCRPRLAMEQTGDDSGEYIEFSPETNHLIVNKNNWESDKYWFDAVFPEYTSQHRVYEVVAKPVVESVMNGFNGTVMAYGQTGTGKTYTLGNLGRKNAAERGIMYRAVEDIIKMCDRPGDKIFMSYIQLYMEQVSDLLNSSKASLDIAEDARTGEVSVPGCSQREIKTVEDFMDVLETGEENRHVANQKLNTESSRSHAVLMVTVVRPAAESEEVKAGSRARAIMENSTFTRGKLLLVDLAGSERVRKTGSEGTLLDEAKFINLSLTSLGKCINALSEANVSHIPYRDSKLTRLLKDSFGGTARTSLIVAIGPSPVHKSETASTIQFGQRALRIENTLKLREEIDFKGLSSRLRAEIDRLVEEAERQDALLAQMEVEAEAHKAEKAASAARMQEAVAAAEARFEEEKKRLVTEMKAKEARVVQLQMAAEGEAGKLQTEIVDLKKQIASLKEKHEAELASLRKTMTEENERAMAQLQKMLADQSEKDDNKSALVALQMEMQKKLAAQKEDFNRVLASRDDELMRYKNQLLEQASLADKDKSKKKFWSMTNKKGKRGTEGAEFGESIPATPQESFSRGHENNFGGVGGDAQNVEFRRLPDQEYVRNQKAAIAKLFDHVGLPTIFGLFESDDDDVRLHAAKVVANLAAEESNQEKIVREGGLKYVLRLLSMNENDNVCRVAAGAIANLAMNENNQVAIIEEGGLKKLVHLAQQTGDAQTQRMVAGAIANLCGNANIQDKVRSESGLKAIISMAATDKVEVLAQVARGFANFAKCDKGGHSQIIEEGGLPWIIAMASSDTSSVRKHAELALCHLGAHEANVREIIDSGALQLLQQIASGADGSEIGELAKRTLAAHPQFAALDL